MQGVRDEGDEGRRYVFVRNEIDNGCRHAETSVYRCEICGKMSYRALKDLGEPQAF